MSDLFPGARVLIDVNGQQLPGTILAVSDRAATVAYTATGGTYVDTATVDRVQLDPAATEENAYLAQQLRDANQPDDRPESSDPDGTVTP